MALVDAQLVMPEAQRVVELVRATGKKLAFVWVTHAHPDHAGGLEAIATAFPGTPLYARPTTVTDAPTLLKKFEAPLWRRYPEWRTMAVLGQRVPPDHFHAAVRRAVMHMDPCGLAGAVAAGGFIHGGILIGQGLSADHMHVLRSFLERTLEETTNAMSTEG